ncbi:MAG: cobalamin B12-binding domain-containing protein [Deltaproteobacteria bacterium]|nr:cobalamin B12-binding domain-containing protein [Deltaproteobacteria bacterium]
MKVMLIYPPITVFGADPTIPSIVQPLGLAYVAGYLEQRGFKVRLLDARGSSGTRVIREGAGSLYGLSDEEILGELEKEAPDAVGISCMWTAYSGDAHRIAKLVKRYRKDMKIIFGGAHASQFHDMVLRDENVDAIVIGEGEESAAELFKRIMDGKDFDGVGGIAYRAEGKIIKGPARKPIENLDSIPFPARHLLDMRIYLDESRKGKFAMRRPSVPLITSRGCPQKCVYCTIHSVWGKSWRGRSPKNVVDEIELLQREYGVKEVYWMDDSAGVHRSRLEGICDEIIKRRLDVKWTTPNGIAHWTLDEKLLDKMKKAGCYRITFGIESGNIEMRKFIGKPFELKQAQRLIRHANKIGMWTICTFIIGFPNETREAIEDTIRFSIDSDTDMAVFYLLCPHPTSKIYEIFKLEGLLNFDSILDPSMELKDEDFAKLGELLAQKGLRTKHFNSDELEEILKEAYSRFFKARTRSFLNPVRIARKIRSIEDMRYIFNAGSAMLPLLRGSGKKHIQMLYNKDMVKAKENLGEVRQ